MTTMCASVDERCVENELGKLKTNFHAALQQLALLAQTNDFALPDILLFPDDKTVAEILVAVTVERLTSVFQYLIDEYVYTKELETKFGMLKLEMSKQQRDIRELKRDREHVEAELDRTFRDATSLQMCRHKYNRMSWSAPPESDDSSHALLGNVSDVKYSTDDESYSDSQTIISHPAKSCVSQRTISPPAKSYISQQTKGVVSQSTEPLSRNICVNQQTKSPPRKGALNHPTKSPPRKGTVNHPTKLPSGNSPVKSESFCNTSNAQNATIIPSESRATSDDIRKSSSAIVTEMSGSSTFKTLDSERDEEFTIVKNEITDYDEDTDNEINNTPAVSEATASNFTAHGADTAHDGDTAHGGDMAHGGDTAHGADTAHGGDDNGETMDNVPEQMLPVIKQEPMEVDDTAVADVDDGGSCGDDKKILRLAPYLCGVCGKGLKTRSGLSSHSRRHQGKAPYQCCGKPFYCQSNLQRHRCSKHQENKPLKCDQCNFTCGVNAYMNQHKKRVHSERTYVCDICNARFATPSHLRDHMDTHTGVRRHVCVCGKSFRYSSGLAKHKRACKGR